MSSLCRSASARASASRCASARPHADCPATIDELNPPARAESNPRWISSALSSSIRRRSSGSASRAAPQACHDSWFAGRTCDRNPRGGDGVRRSGHRGAAASSPGRERLPIRVEHGRAHPPPSGMPAAASSVSDILIQPTSATAIPAVLTTVTRPASAVPVSCSVPPPVSRKVPQPWRCAQGRHRPSASDPQEPTSR
jgi:hypothetical protein